jgi:hypothetical protein
MRKMLTKEVTTTKVKLAKMEMVDGMPQAKELPEETLLGSLSMEQAQKAMSKKHGQGATVFFVEPNTVVYEMPVEEFIEIAKVKEPVEA